MMVLQRRAQLVAHAGQEFALQAVGSLHFAIAQLELLVGLRELSREGLVQAWILLLRLFAIGNVANDGADPRPFIRRPFVRFHRAEADLHREARAVLPLRVQIEAASHGTRGGMRLVRRAVLLVPAAKVERDEPFHRLAEQLFGCSRTSFRRPRSISTMRPSRSTQVRRPARLRAAP